MSDNCLGRAYLLGKILQKTCSVDIIGPAFGSKLWSPLERTGDMTYKFVSIDAKSMPYRQFRSLLKEIDGDIIYASKPLFTSFFIGLLKALSSKKPIILDIDDWELGFMTDYFRSTSYFRGFMKLGYSAVFPWEIGSYFNRVICEKLVPLADDITVSGSFLQKKFGGTIIWHGRDTNFFDPAKFNKESLREKYFLPMDQKIVMFLGTARPHKGVEDLISAVNRIRDPSVVLVVVGLGNDSYSQKIGEMGRNLLGYRFRSFGVQSFNVIPEFLSLSDVIAIPQKNYYSSFGQVPAKVFDAMAMAKPIVATAVSDLPEILDGCGWIVEPDNPVKFSCALQSVLNDINAAEEAGLRARRKCINKYSYTALSKELQSIIRKYQ